MRPILCLADDLTGAASIASGFGELGGGRRLTFEAPEPPWDSPAVVDLGARDAQAGIVAERVVAALRRARPPPEAIVSLRVDSTGLSPLGALLAAAFGELGEEARAFIVPVHPPARRRFVDGRLWAGDDALEWNAEGLAGAALVPLETVRSRDLAGAIGEKLAEGIRILVFEGEWEADLSRVAHAVAGVGGPVVVADPGPFTLALHALNRSDVRVLAIMGSTSSVSAGQVAEAQQRMRLMLVEIDVDEALDRADIRRRADEEIVGNLLAGRPVCVVTLGTDTRREAAEVAGLLGSIAAGAVEAGAVDALYLSVGPVALTKKSALRTGAIAGLSEIDTLASLGRLEGGIGAGLPVALKGGQVGHSGTMVRVLERLAHSAAAHSSRL